MKNIKFLAICVVLGLSGCATTLQKNIAFEDPALTYQKVDDSTLVVNSDVPTVRTYLHKYLQFDQMSLKVINLNGKNSSLNKVGMTASKIEVTIPNYNVAPTIADLNLEPVDEHHTKIHYVDVSDYASSYKTIAALTVIDLPLIALKVATSESGNHDDIMKAVTSVLEQKP